MKVTKKQAEIIEQNKQIFLEVFQEEYFKKLEKNILYGSSNKKPSGLLYSRIGTTTLDEILDK